MAKASVSIEDYLKTICHLAGSTMAPVRTQNIAKKLSISAAAVTAMSKTLSKKNYISYVPYKGVQLTPEGFKQGQRIIRKHRILELYLCQVLEIPWDQVHAEAECLEHATSDRVINQMERLLGFPKYDPHGAPIPDEKGDLPPSAPTIQLSDCVPGDRCVVARVNGVNADLLTYLDQLDIGVRTEFHIEKKVPFDGSLTLRYGNQRQTVSQYLAQHIWVQVGKKA